MNEKNNGESRYIVLDLVFYASSLNYDQGAGNYQELKKITGWDGRTYILVSRYALRYSILHCANKLFSDWKLAKNPVLTVDKKGVAKGVARINFDPGISEQKNSESTSENNLGNNLAKYMRDYPEFDLFGFMSAPKKEKNKNEEKTKKDEEKKDNVISRVSPVKISHAISLTPYRYDSHFSANLDIMKRATNSTNEGSNPVNIEEKRDFYMYNVTIDVNRVGVYKKEEHGLDINDIDIGEEERNKRIEELIETILNLKREIKGRMEDLSPWLAILGLYNGGKYETYMNKIRLAKSSTYKVITKEKESKDENGRTVREIENTISEEDAPLFTVYTEGKKPQEVSKKDDLTEKVGEFLENGSSIEEIFAYKKPPIRVEYE